MRTGMRVRVRWADERVGQHPRHRLLRARRRRGTAPTAAPRSPTRRSRVTIVTTPGRTCATSTRASPQETPYLRGLAEGRLLGQRCPVCGKVYIPPRGACPADGVPTDEEVELPDRGIVTTFCIVNVPFLGQKIKPPYVAAYVLLDGADIAFLHLILDCAADEVRMGMRVEAVWQPARGVGTALREHRATSAPTGEPDAAYETYKRAPVRAARRRRRRASRRRRSVRRADGHHQRRGDAGADVRRVLRPTGLTKTRHRLLVLRLVGLPGRAGVLVHRGGRRDRRVPADQRVARRDGRRLGAVRGLGEDRTGEVDTALVYGFGKSSAGDLRRTLALQLDPYTLAPLWPDSVAWPGCRRGWHRRRPVDRADDGRGGGPQPPRRGDQSERAAAGSKDVDELLADAVPRRSAAHARLRADHRRRGGDRPGRRRPGARRSSSGRPWITGIAHRVDSAHLGARDLTASPSTRGRRRRRWPRRRRGRRAARAVHPPGADPAPRARPRRRRARSTRRAARWPATRCSPPGSPASARRPAGSARREPPRSLAHATSGPGPATEPRVRAGGH